MGLKAKLLALLGKTSSAPAEPAQSLRGTVEYLVSDEELIEPLYEPRKPARPA